MEPVDLHETARAHLLPRMLCRRGAELKSATCNSFLRVVFNPFRTPSPVWGTNYLYLECFFPTYGSAVLKRLRAAVSSIIPQADFPVGSLDVSVISRSNVLPLRAVGRATPRKRRYSGEESRRCPNAAVRVVRSCDTRDERADFLTFPVWTPACCIPDKCPPNARQVATLALGVALRR